MFRILLGLLFLCQLAHAQITPDSIRIPISDDPVTGYERRAYHQNFVITPNLEMVQEIRVVTMHPSGIPMTDFITRDTSLSNTQRQKALLRFADQTVNKSTVGSWLDLRTGKLVSQPTRPAKLVIDTTRLDRPTIAIPDPDWVPDPMIVRQKNYFQHITLGALRAKGIPITDSISVAQLIYLLLVQQIQSIDQRGEL